MRSAARTASAGEKANGGVIGVDAATTHTPRAFMFFRAEYDIFGDTEQVVLQCEKETASRTPVKVRKMLSLKLSSAAARP